MPAYLETFHIFARPIDQDRPWQVKNKKDDTGTDTIYERIQG